MYCPDLGGGEDDGTEEKCEFPEGTCEDMGGVLVDEGCIASGEWALLDSIAPNGQNDVDCGWSQCKLIDGIIFDNCRMCAAPTRCRTYNPAVWKSILLTFALIAVVSVTLHIVTQFGFFFFIEVVIERSSV
uniref:Uncharacterized protein n=1 Tax=Paramoeba aestuarina TaxID=180227 RepID=A0A7S4KTF7_9EUKA